MTGSNGHQVLAETDGNSFASLRQRPTSRAERTAMGKALRKKVPRRSLAIWDPPEDRPDPITLLNRSHQGRVDELVPIRVGRMIASPYGFLRGTAVVMADDVSRMAATGIQPVICGDAHLGNFGLYGSPEGELVLDLNDFDEAHPGGWEWDVRRLSASIWVAGRENGLGENQCRDAVESCVAAYRGEVRFLADRPLLKRSYNRLDVDRLQESATEKELRKAIKKSVKKAKKRTSDRAVPKFTYQEEQGKRIIAENPPLIQRVTDTKAELIGAALDRYLGTIEAHWARVLGGYTIQDIAHKVVGVGSIGLRAYVVLLEGSNDDDLVFLQMKQARRSVLAKYVHGDSAWHAHQGQRVVEYQQALQTVSDPLLGWTTVDNRQYYVRQFRNMKGTVPLDALDGKALSDYASIVGQLLAKGHARTSGASMIAGYLGKGRNVDRAMGDFARAYADQTESDHARLVHAVKSGRVPVTEGALEKMGSAFRPGS
ncbi:MAG TPA: DUF2252 domain-containing protein [Ornithinimicrobium sp.]|uniref:DUF2252 domain-containing protein n=1 Tax=Ornithinimicrobium sp. TaxID=1977084 RepID=UPI002B484714|nr:DUF2252 domain-containing protein [Ornithinimicrobium sp.]HKJ13082.1 DUF2252 domain-containing protein [Ornithinimicrobium sp.]